MGIRINSNIPSLSAQRNLASNQVFFNATLERLSSGFRVNRAADDAAGLAVSEKLRTQVRGLSQAIANAQDSVNLIATAEGGIEQTSKMLQRIRELALQASTDTLVNNDRAKIQEEINTLREELTRIGESTEYNTRRLLNGSIAATTMIQNATLDVKQNVRVGDTSATIPSLRNFITSSSISLTGATLDTAFQIKFISFQGALTDPVSVALEVRSSVDGVLTTIRLTNPATAITQIQLTIGFGASARSVGTLNISTNAISLADIGKIALVQVTAKRDAVTTDSSLSFHVGPNEGQFLRAGIQDMRSQALRLEAINILGTNDEDSRIKAQNAIGVLDQAIDYVSTVRSRLGAIQNRVEFTIANLQVSRENISAADARIRDTDVAYETANLTRAQILVQVGTAMLTQANASQQNALRLIGG